jgi:CDP-diacylglycerol--glycerol-3-phosphate 3-phosphatidyltransferase
MVFMTLANKITSARFFVTLIYFGVLTYIIAEYKHLTVDRRNFLLDIAFALFFVAAASDWLDGYFARKYGEVTHFGRIADPFVDKIIVCGSFTYFLSLEPLPGVFPAWFVMLILAREFLVHGIRSVAEAQGIEFGANFLGKTKLVVQAFTVGTGLWYASHLRGVSWTEFLAHLSMWATLLVTVISGAVYVVQARRVFASSKV